MPVTFRCQQELHDNVFCFRTFRTVKIYELIRQQFYVFPIYIMYEHEHFWKQLIYLSGYVGSIFTPFELNNATEKETINQQLEYMGVLYIFIITVIT